jgi:hypothetical protein
MRLQVLCWGEPSSSSKIVKIAHQQTLGLLLSFFLTLTIWPLLKFLTISGAIELRFKQNLCCWKAKTWGYKFYVWLEPSSASKIVKITHQQTLGLLLSVFCTVTVWPLLKLLTISGVIKLQFKWNLCCWKDKTWGYKFYNLRRTQFCL